MPASDVQLALPLLLAGGAVVGLAIASVVIATIQWRSARAGNAELEERERYFRAVERELAARAYSDDLTGLANRATLVRELDDAMATRRVVGLIFVDLDGFKRVNDTLGHQAGDQLLCEVARRILLAVRPGDLVARLGGDEFAVLLPELEDPDDLHAVAERLFEHVNRPFSVRGRTVPVRASVGGALSGPEGRSGSDLLRNADLAMYDAKHEHRRPSYFRPELLTALEERVEIETQLRQAIDDGQMLLHFQPLVELATGRVLSLEALVRWQHPTKGLLTPSSFVPLAEESDLVVELGRWALEETCRILAEHRQLSIAVNVSGRHLTSESLVDEVTRAVDGASIDPSRLTLEVTETMLLDETPDVVGSLGRLRRFGVKVAIDDFGTGYSSLSKLSRLPVDQLKLDGSFVGEMGENAAAGTVVSAVLGLGRSLDLTVVAEGIETREQLDLLKGMGFRIGQGNHLMPPQPLSCVIM